MRKLLTLLTSLLLFGVFAFAQQRTVTGKVTDEKGNPISAATVSVKGTKRAVNTDEAGFFKISASPNETLVVTSVGFTPVEIRANRTELSLSLSTFVNIMNEVVVTASGTTVQRREQGYNSTTIKAQELTIAKPTNMAAGLSGQVPGLLVSATGGGVNPNYRLILRGQRSLLGNNQALIVMDNVIVPNSLLGNVNPEDIEDIQVLNGAAAVAIYGSDASNGALIITTKKGKRGTNVIKVSNTTTMEHTAFLPKTQKKFGQGGSGYGTDPFGNPYSSNIENQNYGPAYDGSAYQLGDPLEDGSVFMTTYAYKDDWKKFWKTGLTNQSDFSLSSGDDRSTFFFSSQYVNTKGTTPKDKFNRASFRLNGTRKIGKDVDFSFTSFYIQNRYDITTATATMYNNLLNMPTLVPVLKFADWQNDPFANPNGYYNPWYANPYYTLDNNRQTVRNDYFNGSGIIKYTPLHWLSFILKSGLTTSNQSYQSWTDKFLYTNYAKAISGGSKTDIPGGVTEGASFSTQLTSDFQILLNKKISNFSFDLMMAGAIRQNKSRGQSASISGLVVPHLFNLSNTLSLPSASASWSQTRQQAVYGEFKAGYRNYLFLHVTGRNDWVSVLNPDNRSFFYPAGDLSFIATNAIKSLKNIKGLDYLRLRAGVSKVGNVNIGAYALMPTFGQANGYPYSGTAGYTVGNQIVSSSLKPEFTKGWEAGLDFSLFKGFADISATYYNTRTTNQTVPVSISYATGFNTYLFNTGEVANSGVETKLNLTPIKTRFWTVTAGVNYSYTDNTVISINSSLPRLGISGNTVAVPGMAFPVLLGTDYQRDPEGHVIVDAITGFPQVNNTPQYLGNTQPRNVLSTDLNISYKGFHLYSLFEYRGGYVIFNSQGSSEDWAGSSIRTTAYDRKPFVFPNSVYMDAGSGKYVKNTTVVVRDANGNGGFWTDGTYNMGVTSNYVTSGAFWKLRQLSLAYDLPSSLLVKTKAIKSATISVQGRNLFIWLPSANIYTDPEYSNAGADSNGIGVTGLSSPPSRYYGATITLTF
ncbi:MAG: SusC/RagA family TonB-linked outer membrane protein [Chitinophagaceae bacterium]|nr:SusC/RagA family TonB-linked outer membrane protein [Chitinophagaceae bacterium]